ncbi:hypothetical protein KSD_61760 [Ktedonobacter sp. SOSP1-85]|uniref:hypothetical protein n=1 Tax=Ktedonobacter sp. SOSP1-85 TaxID=2778367 RepID=UPI00191512B3|nr:hypothetical protein [Ktedonobacter sp. SOSP1-85]GHO78405.1 hypothetical protein KSD_61760 [Ktedonobacter sp. SOSP1-85]
MEWILGFLTVITLFYVLAVASLAWWLKNQPRPYHQLWSESYRRSVAKMQSSLWIVWVMLGGHAAAFFLPSMIGGTPELRWSASAFALFDLLGAIVLYGLWQWTKALQHQVMAGTRKDRYQERYDF